MPNQVMRAAGAILRVDGVVIAKITSFQRTATLAEEDVTGTEDISGALVNEQFISVSIGTVAEFEGIIKTGEGETVPQELEPGQQDARDAMEAGTQVTIDHVMPSGFGWELTGYLTSFRMGFAGAKTVYNFSASLRVNSKVQITP